MLSDSAEIFLKKALGEEGYEELLKVELYKLKSNRVLDHEEIKTALQIVPRAVMSFLHKELGELEAGQSKEIRLPVPEEAFLHATKFENDVYSGNIRKKSDIIAKFDHRSLPGIGLVVMTTFELYDVASLPQQVQQAPEAAPSISIEAVQKIIDERLGLRSLVQQVVDQKISEREAIEAMIRKKITESIFQAEQPKPEAKEIPQPKESKLKNFLDSRKKKKDKEFKIVMAKSESVSCSDCGNEIFVKGAYSGCICFGEDRGNKIFIKKNEDGYTIRFPKSWDKENIEMLLQVLRSKNRGEV
jgi:hypothetical protein